MAGEAAWLLAARALCPANLMKAISLNAGDTFRYRGKKYDCHGTCKVYVPAPQIAVVVVPKGTKNYKPGMGRWLRIPGDHTVILEKRRFP